MNQVGHVAVQNIKRRWLVGCLILLIGGPVMACCLVGLFTFVLPELDKFVSSDPSGNPPLLLLVLGVILIAGMIIAPSIAMGFVIQRRANMLDSIFLPLGLQGSMYMVVGHHYWGVINHRAVDVYIYRGPTMEIRVYAKSKARVQILPGKSLPVQISGVVNKQPMQGTHPQMSAYAIYADDEAWTQQLVGATRYAGDLAIADGEGMRIGQFFVMWKFSPTKYCYTCTARNKYLLRLINL